MKQFDFADTRMRRRKLEAPSNPPGKRAPLPCADAAVGGSSEALGGNDDDLVDHAAIHDGGGGGRGGRHRGCKATTMTLSAMPPTPAAAARPRPSSRVRQFFESAQALDQTSGVSPRHSGCRSTIRVASAGALKRRRGPRCSPTDLPTCLPSQSLVRFKQSLPGSCLQTVRGIHLSSGNAAAGTGVRHTSVMWRPWPWRRPNREGQEHLSVWATPPWWTIFASWRRRRRGSAACACVGDAVKACVCVGHASRRRSVMCFMTV